MSLWFLLALVGMLFAGLSNFAFKIAAHRRYDAETFNLYGGISSIIFAGVGLLIFMPSGVSSLFLIWLSFLAGMIAVMGGIMKIYALRHIDTTIFYPLFKLLSPLLAILAGIVFFAEQYSLFEWVGMIMGLFVPLLLINKMEHSRQQNLVAGLGFVLATSCISAVAAALNKYVISAGMSEWGTLWYTAWGIFVGTLILMVMKLRFKTVRHIIATSHYGVVVFGVARSLLISISLFCILFAYGHGGSLGIVQSIHSMYIIIPILMSIWLYKEHVDSKKAAAVILSLVALAFLG